jgi:hypothetical protein
MNTTSNIVVFLERVITVYIVGYVCMYVPHIGRIRMDIDSSEEFTWRLDKTCKASNVGML